MSLAPTTGKPARLLLLGSLLLLGLSLVYAGLLLGEMVRQLQEWPNLHQDRDFPWYYLTAEKLWRGQDFYQGLREAARSLGLADYFVDYAVAPPTFALAVAPLALFPYPIAWGIWQLLSLAALGWTLTLIAREVRPPWSPPLWIILGCLVLLFPPLSFHLLYAHTELFILLLLTGAWVSLRRGREIPAGLLLVLAGVLRLYPLLFLLLLLQRRAWRALIAALVGGLGLVFLAGLAAGPASYLRYLEVLRHDISTFYPLWGNASIWGSIHKAAALWPPLGGQPWLRDGLAAVLSLGLLGGTLALTWKDAPLPTSLDRHFALFTAAVLLLSPLSWVYYQVLLYLPFFLLLAAWQEGRLSRPIRYVVVAAWALAFASLAQAVSPLGGIKTVTSFLLTLPPAGVYLALACSEVNLG
ncbi:MAG: glycosyltransferase family 87 protein [Chloroflexia bacterium]